MRIFWLLQKNLNCIQVNQIFFDTKINWDKFSWQFSSIVVTPFNTTFYNQMQALKLLEFIVHVKRWKILNQNF